ncbi:methylated-DNA--[protein]-cysteine S-methyltransferase [Pseudalkalibacillus sp. Hm43]|uniref:methylated-DNA--[protein]-cysteine S-methyltransferase n=1 Tax=Pseudalkalibacillus sp. Hm43 TaxID=3450742 RepID=UPI003F4387F5
MSNVYWGTFQHAVFEGRDLYVAVTDQGLCRITWPTESFETLKGWTEKQVPNAQLIEDEEKIADFKQQLAEYLDGKRDAFSVPIDFKGTAFQTSVWRALTDIPFGETRSYSEIADAIGNPKAVRAVGTANGANPVPIVVPCHRVIGKSNALTGFRGGLKTKERLLHLEGYHDFTQQGHARFQF